MSWRATAPLTWRGGLTNGFRGAGCAGRFAGVSTEALEIQRRIIRAMSPEQKLRASEALRDAAWQFKAAWLRRLHPDLAEEAVQDAVRDWFRDGAA